MLAVFQQTKMCDNDMNEFMEIFIEGELLPIRTILETYPTVNNYTDFDDAMNRAMNRVFILACANGYFEITKWLLKIKPTIDVSYNNNQAFIDTCRQGHRLEAAKWLYNLIPEIGNSIIEQALHGSCTNYECEQCLAVPKWLLELKPSINRPAVTGKIFKYANYYKYLKEVAEWLASTNKDYIIKTKENGSISYKINKNKNKL